MFETEAEKFMENVFPYDDEEPMYGEEQVKGLLAAFAESVHNKVNEWHYVKDGDLPKKEGRYYCIIKTTIITGGYKYDVEIKNRGRNVHSKKWFWADYSDPTWCELELMKVYAWKEIVLPELPKE